MKIHLTTMGALSVGQSITNVDNDELATDDAINADYLYDEQDWHTVVHIGGHADVGTVTLRMYNGETYTSRCAWGLTTWQLCDDAGEPVTTELDD